MQLRVGNCDICVKQKISVIKEMKRDEISLKPKALGPRKTSWNTVKFH